MLKKSVPIIFGIVTVGVCFAQTARAISNIELGGINYEISFESDTFAFNTGNIEPDLQALIEAQPWYTGIQIDSSLALDAASQIYDCGGFEFSSCSIPFDEFGSINPFFGGISPLFVYNLTPRSLRSTAVGFRGENELRRYAVVGSSQIINYAVATAMPVPEPTSTTVSLFAFGAALTLKYKLKLSQSKEKDSTCP